MGRELQVSRKRGIHITPMTTYTFPVGQIIKKDDFFHKILGEAGEVRFISHGWRKEKANKKDDKGLKDSNYIVISLHTIQELNADGYVPASPEESGLVEEWCPRENDEMWLVEDKPTRAVFRDMSWHRVLLKSGLLKRTREEAEEAYKRLMHE